MSSRTRERAKTEKGKTEKIITICARKRKEREGGRMKPVLGIGGWAKEKHYSVKYQRGK